MAITSAGLGSGLDIEGIITKLMQAEAQPLTKLAKKEVSYQAKLTAYGTFNGAVSSFWSASSSLNSTSTINAVSASSSDSSAITTSGTSIAAAGTYAINVTQLAKSQQLVAAGQVNTTASLGSGTITFDFGTISGTLNAGGQYNPGATFTSNGSGSQSVTITAANDSLAGIRDAVNAANIGVTATIINDGSGTPYRLVFSSANQGAANSLKVTATGALNAFLSNDPAGAQNLQETVTAQNAQIQVNGVAVSNNSNTVTSAIPGVTLNLLKTTTGVPVTVTVGRDSAGFSKRVESFVKAYNDLNSTIKELTKYDAKTKQAGLLIGDSTVRMVQSQIRNMITSDVPGITTGAYINISDVGISLQKDGTLSFDSSKLQSALSSNSNDVAALFSNLGRTTDSLISYSSSTNSTVVSKRTIDVTTIATQGAAAGVGAPAGGFPLTITAGVDDGLSVTVDGVVVAVTIAAGTYTTQSTLNSAIQSAINGNSSISAAGSSVAVTTGGGGEILVTSNKYGSASTVSINGGTAATNLFNVGFVAGAAGVDVAGMIGGVAASGSGQYLTTSDGLKLLVQGGAIGSRGTVEFARGLGSLLDTLTKGYLGTGGAIAGKTDGVNKSIEGINDQRARLNLRLASIEKKYRAQFSALDVALSNMSQTSTYLSQQLSALTASSGKK